MKNLGSHEAFSLSGNALLPQEEMLETGKKTQKLVIGIPADTDKNESRMPLTPFAVEQLVNHGHEVFLESKAADKINFTDNDYSETGAFISTSKKEVMQCDIILKVSPLSEEEIEMLRGNQLLITSLHYTIQKEAYFRKLIDKRVTALAFEYIKDENDCFPIVRSMSEIAGSTSILIAAEYLSNVHNGKGEMLGGITGVNSTEVVILGAGTAGEFAARTALGLGALVKVFDTSAHKLRRLQNNIGQRIYTSIMQARVLAKALRSADVVIGAVRFQDDHPRCYATEEMVQNMKKNSVIIDIGIDQGGCFETSRITSHSNPTYMKHGVLHYCVPNIPSRVARTASYAISNIFAPFLIKFAEAGNIRNIIKEDAGIRNGVYLYNGILTKSAIGELFNIPYKDIHLLIAAF
ncbi:MAG: alanine dehydrogenase [Bacteroidota bacterium]